MIAVQDPDNARSTSHLGLGIIYGNSAFAGAQFDSNRQAYTLLTPMGLSARIWLDTPLLARDASGNSLPVDYPSLPLTTAGDETHISLTVTAALANAASDTPGIDAGYIATLFGSGLTDVSGTQMATNLPLPTQISGTSVTVNGIAAPIFSVTDRGGQDQIDFQVPDYNLGLVGGGPPVTIVVNNNGKSQTFYTRY